MLTELSKINAPSCTLSEFNYFFNKAINQYINKVSSGYDINQQSADDLRVLKSTAIIDAKKAFGANGVYKNDIVLKDMPTSYLGKYYNSMNSLYGATYEVNLPDDYLHLLNCICVYRVNKDYDCYDGGSYVFFPAKRLTADAWSTVVTDWYNRPEPERPYYYIHNVNVNQKNEPYNPHNYATGEGTDMNGEYGVLTQDEMIPTQDLLNWGIPAQVLSGADDVNIYFYIDSSNNLHKVAYEVDTIAASATQNFMTKNGETAYNHFYQNSNFNRTITIGNREVSVVQKEGAVRYGNPSKVRMEIRYGQDDSIFELVQVHIDYVKVPQFIRLTQEQMQLTEDTSQIMEFPDGVCQEIINELVHIVMENTMDPRLQTHPVITQSIASPTQQQTTQSAAQA